MDTVKTEQYLTIDEVAGHLKSPKSTIYKWVNEGWIPHYKPGRRLLFGREEVDRWMEKSCHRPGRKQRSLNAG